MCQQVANRWRIIIIAADQRACFSSCCCSVLPPSQHSRLFARIPNTLFNRIITAMASPIVLWLSAASLPSSQPIANEFSISVKFTPKIDLPKHSASFALYDDTGVAKSCVWRLHGISLGQSSFVRSGSIADSLDGTCNGGDYTATFRAYDLTGTEISCFYTTVYINGY